MMFKRQSRQRKSGSLPVALFGLAVVAWIGRALGPELVRYVRLKTM